MRCCTPGNPATAGSPNSRATVVMDHQGDVTVAANVEAVLGDGAALTLISVQDWESSSVHVRHSVSAFHVSRCFRTRRAICAAMRGRRRSTPTI